MPQNLFQQLIKFFIQNCVWNAGKNGNIVGIVLEQQTQISSELCMECWEQLKHCINAEGAISVRICLHGLVCLISLRTF